MLIVIANHVRSSVEISWFSAWVCKTDMLSELSYCHNPSPCPSPKSEVQFQSPNSKSRIEFQSPIPKSKVKVKSPSLKSKVLTLNLKDLDLEYSIQDCDKVECNSSCYSLFGGTLEHVCKTFRQLLELSARGLWIWLNQCNPSPFPDHRTFDQQLVHRIQWIGWTSYSFQPSHRRDDQSDTCQRTPCCSSDSSAQKSRN